MAQIVIDGIDETTLGRLRVLAAAASASSANRLAKLDQVLAMGPKSPGTDSWELIRKDRDSR